MAETDKNDLPLLIAVAAIIVGFIVGFMSTSGSKSQYVRIGDILIFGPIIIYAGLSLKGRPLLSLVLVIIGASTMTYNYKNYREEEAVSYDSSQNLQKTFRSF